MWRIRRAWGSVVGGAGDGPWFGQHAAPGFPPSLYAETARPAPETPALVGEARAAVAIVGAGDRRVVDGAASGGAGVRAVVLDAQAPGWGASGRNGGQVNPGLKEDPAAVLARFGPEAGARLLAFAYGAPDATFELIRRYQIACEARQGGTLRAARTEAHAAGVRRAAAECLARGMPVRLLEGAALAAATGERAMSRRCWTRVGAICPVGLCARVGAGGDRGRGGVAWQVLDRMGL